MTKRRWGLNSRFIIGQQNNPMLKRWRLLQTPLFGLYIHFIYREDFDQVPHDHPWRFWSFVIRGGYTESLWPDARVPHAVQNTIKRGRLRYFPLGAAHRITFVKPKTITLVLVGPKCRTWGFWDGQRFTDYRDALNLRPVEGVSRSRPRVGEAKDSPVLVDHQQRAV